MNFAAQEFSSFLALWWGMPRAIPSFAALRSSATLESVETRAAQAAKMGTTSMTSKHVPLGAQILWRKPVGIKKVSGG